MIRDGNQTTFGAEMFGLQPTIRLQVALQRTVIPDLASVIADKTVGNAMKYGLSEHYDSISGKPLGVRDYCMRFYHCNHDAGRINKEI